MEIGPSTVEQTLPEALNEDRIAYGAVHLDVIDLDASIAFWRDLVGLRELHSSAGETSLGVDLRALVVLHAGAARPVGRGHAGLYHLAIHLPDDVEFARALVRLGSARVPQSPTDHTFSKATYVHDPNGIMLELTLETPERCGSIEIGPHAVSVLDREGRRRGASEPLDVAAAIAPLGDGDIDLPLASGSYVGHVHLHVPDLEAAHSFYRDVVGFREHAYMAPIGMADLSAGGRFPHRMAINTWQGAGARQAPPGAAGMRRYELILRGDRGLGELAQRAAQAGVALARGEDGCASLHDPAGNEITLAEAHA